MRALTVLLCSIIIFFANAAAADLPAMQVRLFYDTGEELTSVRSLQLDEIFHTDRYIDIITDKYELDDLISRGWRTEIIHENLTEFYRSRCDKSLYESDFKTLAELDAYADSIHTARPDIVSSKISIGQSLEGRDTWAFKISDNPESDETEPEILYIGAIHAREVISPLVLIHFIEYLLDGYDTSTCEALVGLGMVM